ncbi:DUF2796 domain-containing protein [Octadecabacter sp. G9-8]|uniref:DUF2796 domain-containing protein n=1 Tax=Octadecabacter dasysiphoniae TaxID=2909341 RepID=A0ABS9CSX5_9RHOB|nr:DUF2796 domain-containing protein [Octadecabacter dasysiphoniae]MCF2870335.1 DUF2796 domain-containing protein [Octadecabacter dasysiphoniae]
MKQTISLIALIAAVPAFAEDTRELDAHEHGVGTLNIAMDGTSVAMEFEAPGADIVGFEYAAQSDEDLAAIETALATLAAPLELFVLPQAAGCSLIDANAELESGEDEHDDHDDHGEDDHDDDDHDEHAEDEHDEHDHDEHAEDEHDEHDHDEHAEEAGHTEFHAAYTLTCEAPDALTEISFAYFDAFPNALEVEVQIITSTGAQAFEVERDAPVLSLD